MLDKDSNVPDLQRNHSRKDIKEISIDGTYFDDDWTTSPENDIAIADG